MPEALGKIKCSMPGCPDPQHGLKTQCRFGNCTRAFHASCAQRADLTMQLEDKAIFCPLHKGGVAQKSTQRKRRKS